MADTRGRESARKRPGMYVGSTGASGLLNLALEVVANSLDEFVAGHATHIDVRRDGDVLVVTDNGRGFPFGMLMDDGRRFDHVVLTEFHHGASADGHAPHVHAGRLHGIGLAAVSALCERLEVEAVRDGDAWRAVCEEGRLMGIERLGPASWRGTRVRLLADPTLFTTVRWPMHSLRAYALDLAYLMRGLTIRVDDEVFAAPNGLADRMRTVVDRPDTPVFGARHAEADFTLEVAAASGHWRRLGFRPGAPEVLHSWCNGARTDEHGTHVDGVISALAKHGWWPDWLFVSIFFGQAEYAGPTRGFLRVPTLRSRIAIALDEQIGEWVAAHVAERQ